MVRWAVFNPRVWRSVKVSLLSLIVVVGVHAMPMRMKGLELPSMGPVDSEYSTTPPALIPASGLSLSALLQAPYPSSSRHRQSSDNGLLMRLPVEQNSPPSSDERTHKPWNHHDLTLSVPTVTPPLHPHSNSLPSSPEHSTTLQSLPLMILDHILDPSKGMDSRSANAFFVTCSNIWKYRQSLSHHRAFFYSFASPYLGLDYQCSPLRFSQSLLQCGRPFSPSAQVALAAYANLSLSQASRADFILACAGGLINLASSRDFLSSLSNFSSTSTPFSITSGIPERFRIQLVHQTLHIKGVFSRLMALFTFPSLTLRQTLEYEFICSEIGRLYYAQDLDALMAGPLASFLDRRPVVTAGCLLRFVQRPPPPPSSSLSPSPSSVDAPEGARDWNLNPPSHDADNPISGIVSSATTAYTRLSSFRKRYKVAIQEYETLAANFDPFAVDGNQIAKLVNQGFLINSPIRRPQGTLYIAQLLTSDQDTTQLQHFLDAGLNIDQTGYEQLTLAWLLQDMFHVRQLLHAGADINRGGATILHEALQEPLPSRLPRLVELVDAGADILQVGDDGHCAVSLLVSDQSLTYLPSLIAHARVNLNRRDAAGETVLFKLLQSDPRLNVLQFLAEEAGLEMHVRNAAGVTAVQVAWELGLTEIARYMETMPDRHAPPRPGGPISSSPSWAKRYTRSQHDGSDTMSGMDVSSLRLSRTSSLLLTDVYDRKLEHVVNLCQPESITKNEGDTFTVFSNPLLDQTNKEETTRERRLYSETEIPPPGLLETNILFSSDEGGGYDVGDVVSGDPTERPNTLFGVSAEWGDSFVAALYRRSSAMNLNRPPSQHASSFPGRPNSHPPSPSPHNHHHRESKKWLCNFWAKMCGGE